LIGTCSDQLLPFFRGTPNFPQQSLLKLHADLTTFRIFARQDQLDPGRATHEIVFPAMVRPVEAEPFQSADKFLAAVGVIRDINIASQKVRTFLYAVSLRKENTFSDIEKSTWSKANGREL